MWLTLLKRVIVFDFSFFHEFLKLVFSDTNPTRAEPDYLQFAAFNQIVNPLFAAI